MARHKLPPLPDEFLACAESTDEEEEGEEAADQEKAGKKEQQQQPGEHARGQKRTPGKDAGDAKRVRPQCDQECPLAMDLEASDLLLEFEEGGWLKAPADLHPGVWGLARGACPSSTGHVSWLMRVCRVGYGVQPSVLAGWLAVPPGGKPMPLTEPEEASETWQEPLIAVAANTGEQIFSSNMDPAKLVSSPLFPFDLSQGSLVQVIADIPQRRLSFRVNGGAPVEARHLPAPQHSDHARSRLALATAGYYPFIALRGAAEVQVLEDPSCPTRLPATASCPKASPVAVLLAGPPGSGKTTWAREYVASKPKGAPRVHVLNAEWLQRRATVTKLDVPASRRPCDGIAAHGMSVAAGLPEASSGRNECPEQEVWPLGAARSALATLLPDLLSRAVARGAALVVDDCNLQAARRAFLCAALAHYPGTVRWLVVLPHSYAELCRRREAKSFGSLALDVCRRAALPCTSGSGGFPVEFAEGRSMSVFMEWWRGIGGGTIQADEEEDDDACAPNAGPDLESFFKSLDGDDLSTDGYGML